MLVLIDIIFRLKRISLAKSFTALVKTKWMQEGGV
jgi:hypothetical protein